MTRALKTKKQLAAFAETQRLQNELDSIVTKELIRLGVPAIPCQASASAIMKNGRIEKFYTEAIKGFLKLGLVPVLYGVPAYDRQRGCSILSGDEIIAFLAKRLGARRIIHGTDVDGVFDSDPKRNENAKLIKRISGKNYKSFLKNIGSSTGIDVTGGMRRKTDELVRLSRHNITSIIVNATKPGRLERALLGKKAICTIVQKE